MIEQFEGEAEVDTSLLKLQMAKLEISDYIDKMPDWVKDMVTGEGFNEICSQLFQKIDEDGNGVLTPEELFPVISEMCADASGMPADERFITLDHCIEFSTMFDKNQDGVVSKEEFSDFVKFALVYEQVLNNPELLPADSEKAGERIMDGLRKLKGNKTKVDQIMDKLPSWLSDMFKSDDFLKQCNDMFDKCDINKNGVLEAKELVPVVMELSQESESAITEEHCTEFIKIFDPTNQVITRESAIEFMKFMFTYEALLSDPDMLQKALDGDTSGMKPAEKPTEKPAEAAEETDPSLGPVDISSLTRVAADDLGMLPQPANPKFKTALLEIYVRNQPYGGSDKSSNGHRYDSIPFANGMINAGMSCQLLHYQHEEHDTFFEVCKDFNALIVRCNPGQIDADGGSQKKFDDVIRELQKEGIQAWPSPDVMEFMGAKDALTKIATLNIGLEDTLTYYEEAAFIEGFKKTMAYQPRVIKQNRGSSGEGIWIIKLKEGNYCSTFGERSCEDSEVLSLMEANDNHAEEHTVAEFIEWCIKGRTDKSGTWDSKGVGKYLEGGKAAGGQIVDQRFCPRIVEGELRYNLVGPKLIGIIHKKPKEGGISAVGGTGSIYTYYGPDEPKFKNLTTNFLEKDIDKVMPALGLPNEPIPLWWTGDFILASPEGTPVEEEKWIIGEFNCSCVGVSKCLDAYCKDDTPNACWNDIKDEDKTVALSYGEKMGTVGRNKQQPPLHCLYASLEQHWLKCCS